MLSATEPPWPLSNRKTINSPSNLSPFSFGRMKWYARNGDVISWAFHAAGVVDFRPSISVVVPLSSARTAAARRASPVTARTAVRVTVGPPGEWLVEGDSIRPAADEKLQVRGGL